MDAYLDMLSTHLQNLDINVLDDSVLKGTIGWHMLVFDISFVVPE